MLKRELDRATKLAEQAMRTFDSLREKLSAEAAEVLSRSRDQIEAVQQGQRAATAKVRATMANLADSHHSESQHKINELIAQARQLRDVTASLAQSAYSAAEELLTLKRDAIMTKAPAKKAAAKKAPAKKVAAKKPVAKKAAVKKAPAKKVAAKKVAAKKVAAKKVVAKKVVAKKAPAKKAAVKKAPAKKVVAKKAPAKKAAVKKAPAKKAAVKKAPAKKAAAKKAPAKPKAAAKPAS